MDDSLTKVPSFIRVCTLTDTSFATSLIDNPHPAPPIHTSSIHPAGPVVTACSAPSLGSRSLLLQVLTCLSAGPHPPRTPPVFLPTNRRFPRRHQRSNNAKKKETLFEMVDRPEKLVRSSSTRFLIRRYSSPRMIADLYFTLS